MILLLLTHLPTTMTRKTDWNSLTVDLVNNQLCHNYILCTSYIWGIHNFLGYFRSIVTGPSWIWIFMKINIFIFEVLKSQDFLDPDFSDTRIWVQDPHKNEWNYGYPHFEGSLTHIYLSKIPPRNYGYPLFEGNNRPYITGTKYIIMT